MAAMVQGYGLEGWSLAPGQIIDGKYRVEELIGRGGMGAVWRARQLALERDVAIKVLLAPSGFGLEDEIVERFAREARSASGIGHPGIVQVFDLGNLEDGSPYIVMELLEGEDLRGKLHREGALAPDQALPIVLQTCDALQAAHDKGIVHRDMKPDNIFLVYRSGRAPTVKLLDFGLSKIRAGGERKLTNTGALLGTPHYMSPEQVMGEASVDHRTDIYAIGAILYEMLTGRSAYDGPSIQSILVSIATRDPARPREVRPELPDRLEEVILQAMAREPDRRFQSLAQMAHALANAGASLGLRLSHSGFGSAPGIAYSAVTVPDRSVAGASGGRPPMSAAPTPAPISVPASSPSVSRPVARPSSGIGAILAVLAVILGGSLVLALLVVAVSVGGMIFLSSEKRGVAGGDEETVSVALLTGEEQGAQGGEGDGEGGSESASGGEAAANAPGTSLGAGTRPWLCCGTKGCAVAVQRDTSSRSSVHVRMLGKDLEPAGEPVELTGDGENGRWPACFAREDGGALVLWQDAGSPFDFSEAVKLHRVVVSADGKVGKRQTLAMYQIAVIDEFESSYSATRAGDKIIVAWNNQKDVDSSLRVAVLGMDGAAFREDIVVHQMPTVHQASTACSSNRCVVAWVRPSLPMNHIQKLSVVTTGGEVVSKEINAFDRGILIGHRSLVATEDGVVLAWVETNDVGEASQMVAGWGWDGKVLFDPARIEAFGKEFDEGDCLTYVAGSASAAGAVLVRTLDDETSGMGVATWAVVDSKGKVTSKGSVAVADEDIEEAAVFMDTMGKPVLVYGIGTFESDRVLHAVRIGS